MLLCGLRVSEVLQLKLHDVRFADGTVRVQGKGKKERSVPLPPVVISIIENYLRFERAERSPSNHLFVVMQGKHRGQPMTYQGLRSIFRRRRRDKAMRNANPHSWRHTCGTDLARSGVGIVSIKHLLGHADIQTTAQYINLSMSDISKEYQKASAEILARYRSR
jgi:site-specific recombinase XerD